MENSASPSEKYIDWLVLLSPPIFYTVQDARSVNPKFNFPSLRADF